MQIGGIPIGDGAPLALISGLNVLEKKSAAVEAAQAIQRIARRHGIPLIFKASFDKANRSKADAFRGPGLDAGLEFVELGARAAHQNDLGPGFGEAPGAALADPAAGPGDQRDLAVEPETFHHASGHGRYSDPAPTRFFPP